MATSFAARLRAPILAAFAALATMTSASAGEPDGAPPEPVEPQTIGVFGDSLADGLWAGLNGAFRRDDRVASVERLSEVSTGLANWVYRDIAEKTEIQLSERGYDIAVVMFGSNDMQGIRDANGGVHRFRSESWEAVYRDRIDQILAQLIDHGATVYWVGLPVMRSDRYDANVRYLNSLFEEHAEAAGAVYVSTRAVTEGADGGYAAYLPDARGVDRLMRADDGIHFTLPGYRRLAGPVVEAIEYGWANPPEPAAEARDGEFEMLNVLQMEIGGELWICRRPEDDPFAALGEPAGR
ncbi:MAG: DUF459 domain-containing protein [Oceanicaulis sp.]